MDRLGLYVGAVDGRMYRVTAEHLSQATGVSFILYHYENPHLTQHTQVMESEQFFGSVEMHGAWHHRFERATTADIREAEKQWAEDARLQAIHDLDGQYIIDKRAEPLKPEDFGGMLQHLGKIEKATV